MTLQINSVYTLKKGSPFLKIGEFLTYRGDNKFTCSDGLDVWLTEDMVEPVRAMPKDARRAACDAIINKAMQDDTLFLNLISLANGTQQ